MSYSNRQYGSGLFDPKFHTPEDSKFYNIVDRIHIGFARINIILVGVLFVLSIICSICGWNSSSSNSESFDASTVGKDLVNDIVDAVTGVM